MRCITNQEIAARVYLSGESPQIVIAVGPCRSGTTLYLRLFAQLGIQSWYQPLKSVLRGYLHELDLHLVIPNHQRFFIKETLGPYISNEVLYNPIEVLLEAGVPKEKIHVLALMREPLTTVSSWIEQFSEFNNREDLVDVCLLSYESMRKIKKNVESLGIASTTFVYEAWRDNEPLIVVKKLFDQLKIPFSATNLSNWQALPSLTSKESNIFMLDEPAFYHYKDFFITFKQSRDIVYHAKSPEQIHRTLSPERIKQIAQSHAPQIYEEFIQASERDLDLKIRRLPILPVRSRS